MVDIGSLRLVIGADTTGLKRGVDDGVSSMKTLDSQLSQVSSTLRTVDGVLLNFSGQLGAATRQGRELTDVFLRPLKNALFETAAAWGLYHARMLIGMKTAEPEVARFTGSLLENTIQMKRLGLEGAQITGMLKKMGDDFVQIQPPMRQQFALTGQLSVATGLLAGQFGTLAPQVAQTSSALQLMTMGGVIGGVVVAVTAAVTVLKRMSDEWIALGQSAQFANMSLSEFQALQKSLEVSGGLTSEKFASGAEAIAKNLFAATRESNELNKWLKVNNVEFERGGKLTLSTGDAIKVMADMIRNAADGAQKLRIASAFGVDRSWVAAVEQGGDALQRLVDTGPRFAAMVDDDMIRKAREFSEGWRFYTDQAITWFQAWANSAISEIRRVADERLKGDQIVQDARDVTRLLSLIFNVDSWMGNNEKEFAEIIERLKNSVVSDFTAMKNDVISLFEQMFGDEKTRALIEARRQAIKQLTLEMTINNLAMEQVAGVSAPAPAPTPTKDPEVEKDASIAEHLKRRLEFLRQAIATEDEALRVQKERWLSDLKTFQEAELITKDEHAKLKLQVEEKYQEKLRELNFQKFQESFMTETELLAFRQAKQLKDLEMFEANKTLIEKTAGETRMRLEEKHVLDRLQLQARLYSGLASIVDTALGQISGIMEDEGEKGFTVMKALAMATALVKGFEAVVSAYAFGAKIGGPPLGIAMAAVAAAGTGAVIAKLAGVGPKSTGTTAGAISGGGGGAAEAASATPQSGGSNQTLTVSGINSSEWYSGEMVRELAQRLIDFQRDGGKLVLA